MRKSCIITVTQGDFDYLSEWIEHHHNIGVDLFLIAYNGHSNNMDKLPKYDYVKYFDCSYNDNTITDWLNSIKIGGFSAWTNDNELNNYNGPLQERILTLLYKQVLFLYKQIDYTIVIDTDEFIFINYDKEKNINKLLEKYFPDTNSSIKIGMQFITDSGNIYKTDEPVTKRFKEKTNVFSGKYDRMGNQKPIINNRHKDSKYINILSPHTCSFMLNGFTLPFSRIKLYHYFTKSLEEWISKFSPKYDNDYCRRFANNMFGDYINFNKMTDEKIKAIPGLLKKYNIDYDPGKYEKNEEFRNRYNELNK